MGDADLALALALQAELNNEYDTPTKNYSQDFSSKTKNGVTSPSLVDEFWELNDPNPDIRALFLQFNDRFFWGRLAGIEVKWSPRMTVCAGICCYEGRGGLCSIRLSTPLLKLRPRRDLVETLLHEMIHAYLFVTDNNKDHDGHGPEFHKHMYRINAETGTKISVYHNFHDEVEVYKTHWWRCNGSCQQRKPYFGYVKRSMNRAPSANDFWWGEHQRTCGGTFIKIKEPEGYGQKKKSSKKSESKSDSEVGKIKSKSPDIRSFWGSGKLVTNTNKKTATITSNSVPDKQNDKVILNGVLTKKISEDDKNVNKTSIPATSTTSNDETTKRNVEKKVLPKDKVRAKIPTKGNNSSHTSSSGTNVEAPMLPVSKPISSNNNNNVMRAKSIWNKDREQVPERPTFKGSGNILGSESKDNVKNTVQSSSKHSSTTSKELNVMQAKTIWNIDNQADRPLQTFTGKGDKIGGASSQTELSWLAQLRKEMGINGKRKSNSPPLHHQPYKQEAVDVNIKKAKLLKNGSGISGKMKDSVHQKNDSSQAVKTQSKSMLQGDSSQVPSCSQESSVLLLESDDELPAELISTFFSNSTPNLNDERNTSSAISEPPESFSICPVCQSKVKTVDINAHLDDCLD